MEYSPADNEQQYRDRISEPYEPFLKDSPLKVEIAGENHPETSNGISRGIVEIAPLIIDDPQTSILSEPLHVHTDKNCQSSMPERSSVFSFNTSYTTTQKKIMSQSCTDRPWMTSSRNNSISTAIEKQREDKLRLAKEESEMKHKEKVAALRENELHAEKARRRKEAETQRNIDEIKVKIAERQRRVVDRREMMRKAEKERRNEILRRTTTTNNTKPCLSMTVSCYAGLGNARTRTDPRDVVKQQTNNVRPVSSTGNVIGFGSSTPRPICENNVKLRLDKKTIPDAILKKCEILSRPSSSRMSEKMAISVTTPQAANGVPIIAQRQSTLKSKEGPRAHSSNKPFTEDHCNNKSTPVTFQKRISSSDSSEKECTEVLSKNLVKKSKPSPSTLSTKALGDRNTNGKTKPSTYPRVARRTKIGTQVDSDSIEEEPTIAQIRGQSSMVLDHEQDALTTNLQSKPFEGLVQTHVDIMASVVAVRSQPTKDISEAEYKERLMENRRLMREKREKEREQLMKEEKCLDKREKYCLTEESEMMKSKENVQEGLPSATDDQYKAETLPEISSEVLKVQAICAVKTTLESSKQEDEKNERKKKLNSIMNRVRKNNENSSSEGGTSPQKSASPEPMELDSDVNNTSTVPAFRSSLLQSMMKKGRLSKGLSGSTGSQDRSLLTVAPSVEREECDGKEDSPTLTENGNILISQNVKEFGVEPNVYNFKSVSSTEP